LYRGAAAVLLPAFDPAAALNAIEQFRVTYAVFLPALLQFVLEEQQRSPRDVSSLRAVLAGGDTVSVALQERAVQLFSRPVQEVYGMTEAVPITVTPGDGIRPGSIGMVAYGCEIRLVDPNGADVTDGAIGEIVVRSRAACRGYWADPEATAAALGNGWLRTGDLASRDADGYYWFKGRCKQLIIRAGSNISPQEVEEILYQHPAVLEAGVIGSPDAVYGETVVAFVTLRRGRLASPDELRQFARERLADYKVPERIILLGELPKGLTGKVHRRALKEMVQAGVSPNCVMGYQRT
jgi:long-chain acyl-CoA synthetase